MGNWKGLIANKKKGDLSSVTADDIFVLEEPLSEHPHTKSDVGLGNVDNTSDIDKPVSTAQQTEIDTRLEKQINIQNLWRGTQAAYDALTPEANTIYFIEE